MTRGQQFVLSPTFRWCASFVFVVAVFASAVLAILYGYSVDRAVPALPAAAMMVELAPMPVAPQTLPQALPPAPVQKEILPPPDLSPEPEFEPVVEPVVEPIVEPLVELPVLEEAEAVLPKKPELVEEKAELMEEPLEQKPEQQETAPPIFQAPLDEVAAAPTEGTVSLTPSQAPANWQSALLGHLEKHKRYPRQARRRGQEAVIHVRVKISRDGMLVGHELTAPSQYSALNRESLALIARAEPLPPPPDEIGGETVEFVVPVAFYLHR